MLYTQTVAPRTLELLKKLEAEPSLAAFSLAGGTALALYLGHRKSVDLDLFSPQSFDAKKLATLLADKYGFRTDFMETDTLKGTIDGVKVDCIAHRYDYLRPPYEESGIRLYDMEDIIAMKLSAIADDGSRLKDFVDIACLSTRHTFYDMLKCYERKFPEANVIRPFKAITYFDDIDFEEDVIMLNFEYDWNRIAERLKTMTVEQNRIFTEYPLRKKPQISVEEHDAVSHRHGRKR
ncbi:MAG: nucleotidyl transferase AbiEii/AbiGii toxin family protein [Alistipes sp.]|uniref:nucleotidyl transferase AbiEii/AbiGii toxin family protein n=1 Tax=Alistipes sp. TaxID=1872444 RepID=UPI001DE3C365|nr:nucleotidyl transferase AbiEii/AbiGii toxin family protein [Alistipes sp.]MBS5020771.1 nucleotidyl transferase AbiEii/AbiGii toxin family protein [Alistipes sp.]